MIFGFYRESTNRLRAYGKPLCCQQHDAHRDYGNYVAVNFTNTYDKQASEVDIFILLYDANGNIIGGGHDWTTEPTPAGATTEIEIWVDYSDSKEIDSIQAWVVPNYWTEFK